MNCASSQPNIFKYMAQCWKDGFSYMVQHLVHFIFVAVQHDNPVLHKYAMANGRSIIIWIFFNNAIPNY